MCFFVRKDFFRGLQYYVVVFGLFPQIASADVVSTLQNFLDYLTGPLGKVIAALSIVSMGFACFVLGKLPKSYVIAVVVGIGLIFGSSALVNTLAS
jgi:type IV secretory pathway VirB2 component (pilin)